MLNVRVTVQYKCLFSTEHLLRLSSWYIIRHNNHTTPTYCLIWFRMLMNSCLRLVAGEQLSRPTNGKIQTKIAGKKCCHYDFVFASIGRFVANTLLTLCVDLSEIKNNKKKFIFQYNDITESARIAEPRTIFFHLCNKTIATTAARIRYKQTHLPYSSQFICFHCI